MVKLYAPRTGVEADVTDTAMVERLAGEGWTRARSRAKGRKTPIEPPAAPSAEGNVRSGD